MNPEPDVVIVGGGLAGLACARGLLERGISFQLLEASDRLGGRVRTDHLDGFLLDRGFQVLPTAYPEAQRLLDYQPLRLHAFYPGALVYLDGSFQRIADPWRRPLDSLKTLFNDVGTLADKVRVARLRRRVLGTSLPHLFERPETTTLQRLQKLGFSSSMIERFFRPFFAGVFLEHELRTSSRLFEFVFRMFADGDIALPEEGMAAIPRQLADGLPLPGIRLNTRVKRVEVDLVELETGEELSPQAVVVATDGPEAARLLEEISCPGSRSVTCSYFAADHPPLDEPILVLNGTGAGPINNLCVPSVVSPSYAPAGAALISVTILGDGQPDSERLLQSVRDQLQSWFGTAVQSWRHLRTDRIAHGLPEQAPPVLNPVERPVHLRPGLYVCGDHRETASIQGALHAGRRAAEAVIDDLN